MIRSNHRFSRQEILFTKAGQQKIIQSRVGIVGTGGIGSHVVQQLSFLGVGTLVLIDDDILQETNRNRLVGVHESDKLGRKKAYIAKRLIKSIDRSINVQVIPKQLKSEEAFKALLKCDYVFGCVDNDGARLLLNELSLAYLIPYFDLASEIKINEKEVGGRIILVKDEHPCLYCLGEIDPHEARRYLESENARRDESSIYGVSKDQLEGSGPSVVTLNGIIASVACNEFMLEVTGLRPAYNHLVFYGTGSSLRRNLDKQSDICYSCKMIKGRGDNAELTLKQEIYAKRKNS